VAHRWQRLKPIVLWTAGLCLLSTSWPLLSRPNEILDGIRVHAQDSMGDSTQLELLVTGQRPVALELPADPNDKTKQLDLLVSGALLPFAARRMSVRLVGDVLFEPISTCILAVGLLALLGTARSDRASRALLGFTVVGLAPAALTSALPRLSFYRAIQLVALVPLIIGFGAVTIRTSLRNVRIVNGVVTALVVLILGSGWVIFDHINPRILPASAAALLAEVLDGVPPDRRAMVLDYPGEHGAVGFHALPYADVMRHLPIPPVRTVALSGAASLLGTDGRPAAEIIAWPPSIEADANAAAAVCRLAPGARLLVVFDRPKTSKVVVAVLDPRGWTPSVSTDRLLRFHCDKVGTPAWRSQLGLDRWPPGARVANWNSSE